MRVRSPYERGSRVLLGKHRRHHTEGGRLVGILIWILRRIAHNNLLEKHAALPAGALKTLCPSVRGVNLEDVAHSPKFRPMLPTIRPPDRAASLIRPARICQRTTSASRTPNDGDGGSCAN